MHMIPFFFLFCIPVLAIKEYLWMFLNFLIILAETFNYHTFPLQDLFESVSFYRWELWQRVQEMTSPRITKIHPAEHSELTVGLLSHNRTLYYWQFFLFLEQSPFLSLLKTAAKIIFLCSCFDWTPSANV